jgi:hypothetical protein
MTARPSFCRAVVVALATSMALTGCAGHYDNRRQDWDARAGRVTSIAAVPVDVRVLSWGLGGGARPGWSVADGCVP